jgi:large subunit ribosomal protein L15
MLKLNEIKPAPGAKKSVKRVGRGQGNGKGCTAGHGYNGHKARSGSTNKPYFEGGQTPLTRRLPKRGFFNNFKAVYQIINVGSLEALNVGDKEITVEVLFELGLVNHKAMPVKVLGDGEVTKPLIIKAHSFSKSAREKIEKAKGKAEVVVQ